MLGIVEARDRDGDGFGRVIHQRLSYEQGMVRGSSQLRDRELKQSSEKHYSYLRGPCLHITSSSFFVTGQNYVGEVSREYKSSEKMSKRLFDQPPEGWNRARNFDAAVTLTKNDGAQPLPAALITNVVSSPRLRWVQLC